jgi:hypothetical protein
MKMRLFRMFWKKKTPKFIDDVLKAVSEKEEQLRKERLDFKNITLSKYRELSIPLFDILQGYWMHLPVEIYGIRTEKVKIVSRKPESYGKAILIHLFWNGECLEYIVYRMSTNADGSLDWELIYGHKNVNELIRKLPSYIADWVLT